MTSHANPAITLDQQVALKTASTRLQKDFTGIYGAETIERFLRSSYDEFAGRATTLTNHHAAGNAVAWSGGSEPGTEVNPSAVAAMAERGIDISGEFPKPWTDEVVRAADVVITMGCGDACPIFPGKKYEDWELADPAGMAVEDVRPVGDEIERRVLALLDQLHVPVAAS